MSVTSRLGAILRRKIDHDKSHGLTGSLFTPASDWVPCREFPDLSGEKTIGLDTETFDPYLRERGPGFLRGDAKVVGISIATLDRAWYFPFDHLGGGNLERRNIVRWAGDLLSRDDRFIVGANLQYEIEGLRSLGIQARGRFVDVQVAEALIDEEQETYQLEALCMKYLGAGKDESLLREAAAAYGVDPKKSLWKLHSKYVGPYAEWDAQAPLFIFQQQVKELEKQGLNGIFQLESELLPLLALMRQQGVPVDLDAAAQLSEQLKVQEDSLRLKFRADHNRDLDEWSGPMIAMLCDEHRILYPRTAIGNPSFTADYLDDADHPLLEAIAEIRKVNKFRNTFVNDWVLKWQINGRIHPSWRQVARDEGGVRYGRMAAANPNPQQVPASKFRKTGKPSPVGQAIRGLFTSDTGLWWKGDYKQQEPRLLVHFAALSGMTGAATMRMAYQQNPELDCYQFMVDAAHLDRRPAKDVYLARSYGMGAKKLANKWNKTKEEAQQIMDQFDLALPFVKELSERCSSLAQSRGYIKTLLGRRCHFGFWEPREYGRMEFGDKPLPHDLALQKWGSNIRRANTHKALNRLIQGSAADMTKASMVRIWKEERVIPYFQMHDELDCPVFDEAQGSRIKKIGETSVETTIPILVDVSLGRTWK